MYRRKNNHKRSVPTTGSIITLPAFKRYSFRRRIYNKGRLLSFAANQRANAAIASIFNLEKFLIDKDAKPLKVNEHGAYILDPNNPADRLWMED
ncbi:hypothetical protein [Ectobacillus sp. sgz5001026]|uniref:hypothetical protein n=1 Tax=Ectobacillus sp. sgz5001026 TaxID=3242473 RepID=UPI0036D3EC32